MNAMRAYVSAPFSFGAQDLRPSFESGKALARADFIIGPAFL